MVSGGTPSKSEPEYWGGNIPWFSSKEVRGFELADSELHVTTVGAERGAKLVPPGTVLFVIRGMSLASEFRVGVTSVAATFNQDVKALIPAGDVDARYLARCLRWRTPQVLGATGESSHGTKRLEARVFDNIEIPVPSMAEQRRIADMLDRADAMCRKRKEVIALTEELLRSAFLDMFGDPVTNPRDWDVTPLGDLGHLQSGGTPSRARADFFEGDVPWATAKDFRSDVMIDTQEHVSKQAVSGSATRIVPAGTVLVVVKSKILMRRLPVAVARVPLCFNQDVKGMVLNDPGESSYIAAHLRLAERQLLKLARGVNTEGLTVGHLREHLVMRPPMQMIREFAAFDARARRSLEPQRDGLRQAGSLFGALSTEVFARCRSDVAEPC